MPAPTDAPFGPAWIEACFQAVDRMDPDGLRAWYAEGGSFRFAGQPRVTGKPAIREILVQFYASIRGMRHHRPGVRVDEGAQSGVWEAEVEFAIRDGRHVTHPAVSVLRLREGLVHDFRFVMDAAPLRAGARPPHPHKEIAP